MRFRADQHLRRASDFNHVRTQGRRFDCGAFVLFYAPRREHRAPAAAQPAAEGEAVAAAAAAAVAVAAPAPAAPEGRAPDVAPPPRARAGFVASRSAVGNAVERARAKRRLREGFRAHQTCFPAGVDFIFVARRSLNGLEQAALERRFGDLCRKLFPTLVS